MDFLYHASGCLAIAIGVAVLFILTIWLIGIAIDMTIKLFKVSSILWEYVRHRKAFIEFLEYRFCKRCGIVLSTLKCTCDERKEP